MLRVVIGCMASLALVGACSDDGAPADANTTTEGDGTAASDDGTTATTDPGTGSDNATLDDGPGSSEGTSAPTTSSDGTSTGTDATGSSSDATSSEGSSSGSSSGESSSSDDGMGDECVTDGDCVLVNDCCTCDSIPITEPLPPCNLPECLINTCTAMGMPLAMAVCEAGICELN